MRYLFFWDIMHYSWQLFIYVLGQPFGPAGRFKVGLIGCPHTSVMNHQCLLCSIPEECRYHVLNYWYKACIVADLARENPSYAYAVRKV